MNATNNPMNTETHRSKTKEGSPINPRVISPIDPTIPIADRILAAIILLIGGVLFLLVAPILICSALLSGRIISANVRDHLPRKAGTLPAPQAKCQLVGVRCIALFAFLFFGMGVSIAQEIEHVLGDLGVVSDQREPQSLKSGAVPKEQYAIMILDTRINDQVIATIKNLESIGFVVESATNTKENCTELILRIHPSFKGSNYQSGSGPDQSTDDARNQIREGVVHVNLPMVIAGAIIGVLLACGIWEGFRWVDARCFDILQSWNIKNGIYSANVF